MRLTLIPPNRDSHNYFYYLSFDSWRKGILILNVLFREYWEIPISWDTRILVILNATKTQITMATEASVLALVACLLCYYFFWHKKRKSTFDYQPNSHSPTRKGSKLKTQKIFGTQYKTYCKGLLVTLDNISFQNNKWSQYVTLLKSIVIQIGILHLWKHNGK